MDSKTLIEQYNENQPVTNSLMQAAVRVVYRELFTSAFRRYDMEGLSTDACQKLADKAKEMKESIDLITALMNKKEIAELAVFESNSDDMTALKHSVAQVIEARQEELRLYKIAQAIIDRDPAMAETWFKKVDQETGLEIAKRINHQASAKGEKDFYADAMCFKGKVPIPELMEYGVFAPYSEGLSPADWLKKICELEFDAPDGESPLTGYVPDHVVTGETPEIMIVRSLSKRVFESINELEKMGRPTAQVATQGLANDATVVAANDVGNTPSRD